MKKIAIVFTLIICIGTFSCQKSEMNNNTPDQKLKNIPARFATQSTDFAFEFWKKLHAQELAHKNYFVSPLSLHIALGMLLNGADNQTKKEIEAVLRLSGNQTENNEIYKSLIENLPNADPKVVNKIANSVWYRNDFIVEKGFLTNLQDYFMASILPEDFSKPATVDKINKWASDNTNAKITKVLKEISADQVMFLMNALYFKGDWKIPFDKKNTVDAEFSNLNGSKKSVKMMNMTEKVKYAKQKNYHAVQLSYGSGNYNMTVLMPLAENKQLSVNEIINNLDTTEWSSLNNNFQEQKTILSLPKFGIEYEIKLNQILSAMGMPTAFSATADLSKISPPAGKLVVGFVKQNTFVAVDEVGTEAAAVTTIGIELTSVPVYPEFVANRPFIFVISEKQSNTIMFVGKVVNL
jgi:serine protease inhibitor